MTLHKTRAPLVAALIASLFSNTPHAADAELGQVVVTATRQATRSNELLSDVSVITRDEIEKAGQTSLEQLLARQPGVEYTANGGPGTNASVFIRGASTKQTIVLIDGLRVGSASSGDVAFSRIPLAQIERIEILRGPGSSLYGADAIGGVIQIFTRRGDGVTRYNASAGYGTYNTTDATAGVSGGSETVSYSLQAGHYQTSGFNAVRNPANKGYNIDRDGYRDSNHSGSLSFRPAKGHEFGFNVLHSNGISLYDSGTTAAARAKDYSNEQIVSSYSAYTRNRLADAWTSTLRLGRSTDDATSRAYGLMTSVFRTDQDQISWQNDVKLPVGQALLAAEHLKQRLTGTSSNSVNERAIRSLLAGWTGNLGEHRLQGNLRRDENSQYGGKNTGFAAYGYQLTADWRSHLSYGTAFRAPSFNELYSPIVSTYQGNPNLRPEFARNREIGLDWERGAHHFSAVYFYNKVSDLISNSGLPLQNVSSATLQGNSLSYAGTIGNWNGGASIDLQSARDESNGNRLYRRAEKQVKTYLNRAFGAWNLGGEWQVSGDRFDDAANTMRIGGYALLNLTADYRLEKDWTLFARANNVFDKKYELAQDFATPGANVFVGIRYSPQ